jgi:F-box-like
MLLAESFAVECHSLTTNRPSDPRSTSPEIASLDAEMAALTAKLTDLTVLRTKLLAARALINNIPPELLSRVFELAVHSSPPVLANISLVSRSWYSIVLSTPCLHTYIKLDETWGYHGGGDDTRTASETFLDKTKLQLSRSHDSKLLIDIDFRYLDGISDVHSIMKELSPHLHRCFVFRASTPDWDWLGAVREHSSPLGPSLEELYLYIDSSDSEGQTPVTFLSTPCPRLSTICLEHTPLTCIRPQPITPSTEDEVPLEVPLPLTTLHPSLRHLNLIRDQRQSSSSPSSRIVIPLSHLLSTLAETPSITSLHIQSAAFMLNGTEDIFLPYPPKIRMPNLELLMFNFVDTTNVGLFLENVECDNLKTLRVQMDGAGGAEDSVGFLSKICASNTVRAAADQTSTIPYQPQYNVAPFPALRHLDLRAISTTGPALYTFIRALHGLSQLTALAISSPPSACFGSKLWEILSQPSKTHEPTGNSVVSGSLDGSNNNQKKKQQWVLPRLTALVVQNARDVSGHEILRVVRARKEAVVDNRLTAEMQRPLTLAMGGEEASSGSVPEEEADVAEIKYLKIAACYALDREGEVVDDLKRLVERVFI